LGTNVLTFVSDIDNRGPAVFDVASRGGDDRIYRAALRHSRYVRALRWMVPLSVVLAVLGGTAYVTVVKPLRALAKLPVDIGNMVVSGTKITMQQPRIAGFTRDQRQYELTAQAAARDILKPDVVELEKLHATMEMQNKVTFKITANNGFYDTKTELLTLERNILVTTTSGYQAKLAEAVVDIKGGKIVSDKPVEVKSVEWLVQSNRMEVRESGDVIRFERGVFVTIQGESAMRIDAAMRTR
jgi:lipopolysaccharide export system protein LptC